MPEPTDGAAKRPEEAKSPDEEDGFLKSFGVPTTTEPVPKHASPRAEPPATVTWAPRAPASPKGPGTSQRADGSPSVTWVPPQRPGANPEPPSRQARRPEGPGLYKRLRDEAG